MSLSLTVSKKLFTGSQELPRDERKGVEKDGDVTLQVDPNNALSSPGRVHLVSETQLAKSYTVPRVNISPFKEENSVQATAQRTKRAFFQLLQSPEFVNNPNRMFLIGSKELASEEEQKEHAMLNSMGAVTISSNPDEEPRT